MARLLFREDALDDAAARQRRRRAVEAAADVDPWVCNWSPIDRAAAQRATAAAAATDGEAADPFARLMRGSAADAPCGSSMSSLVGGEEGDGGARAGDTDASTLYRDERRSGSGEPTQRRPKEKSARRKEKDAAWRAKSSRERELARERRAEKARTPCRFNETAGGCRNGDACPYSHSSQL